MSTPLGKTKKTVIRNLLTGVHQRISHKNRVRIISRALRSAIAPLLPSPARALDIGCGDMTIADQLEDMIPDIEFTCIDVHECSEAVRATDPRWARYRQYDGVNIPYCEQRYDVGLFIDVLHHVDPDSRRPLLLSASEACRVLVIKDHFEYGMASRQCLRLMDFIGNYAYGVPIPREYFTATTFASLCEGSGLTIESLQVGIDLYGHLPLVRRIAKPNWQFIAVCRKSLRSTPQ